MKTEEIRQKDKDGFLVLPQKFTSKNFTYIQLERDGDFAIYKQVDKLGNKWFLPMVIQKYEAYEIAGNVMQATEKIPRDEMWGQFAHTCMSLKEAQEKLKDLKQYVSKLEKERNKS